MTELCSFTHALSDAEMIHKEVLEVLSEAKMLALRFYWQTGKPLGITGEVAEYKAATKLGLELHPARKAGHDATESKDLDLTRVQFKGRCVLNPLRITARLGSIDLRQPFGAMLLVPLDSEFNAFAMYEASRSKVEAAQVLPGSKARNGRGALAIRQFMSIGTLRRARHNTVFTHL